jgi:3-oxoacyl-[acyl-carrier protein] reductase
VQSLSSSPQGKAHGHTVDISKSEQVSEWVNQCVKLSSRIDAVVSNVSALAIDNSRESWDKTYQADIVGTYALVDAALPRLKESKGSIVTISSVSGRYIDFTAPSPYGAFKAALTHYTSQLAHRLAPHGVRANSVSPGNIYVEDGVWGNIEREQPEFFAEQVKANPMGRMGKPQEVADAVVWLASNRASFVSGTNLLVDGAVSPGVQF